jgi:large subunit ribosomal protein L22
MINSKDHKENFRELGSAKLSQVRVSPRKARLVVDLVRGQSIGDAIRLLGVCQKKSATLVKKVILSAVGNAKDRNRVDVDELYVVSAQVNMGKTLKRHLPRAQGRATPLRKRSSHIEISVGYK